MSRAESRLGYRPRVSLEQGLREYMQWMQSKACAPRWWVS